MSDNFILFEFEIMDDYFSFKEKLSDLNSKIVKRVDYIIKTIFGNDCEWFFPNATYPFCSAHGDVGKINIVHPKMFDIRISHFSGDYSNSHIIFEGEEIYLNTSLPIKWLYSDFSGDLIKGRELFKIKKETGRQLKEQQKLTKQESDKKRKQIWDRLMNGLTLEEKELFKDSRLFNKIGKTTNG